MLQHQVEDMRETVGRIVDQPRPPDILRIKMAHAEYLGIKHWFSKPINERSRTSHLIRGVPYGAVVCVYTSELYEALKNAEGTNVKERKQRQSQAFGAEVGGAQNPQPNHHPGDHSIEGVGRD